MGFNDFVDPYMGVLTDELDSDIPQEIINSENLLEFDRIKVFEMLGKRIDALYIKQLLKSIDYNNSKYIEKLVNSIIKEYSIPYIRIFFDMKKYDTVDLTKKLYECIIYIKINLPHYIENQEINKEISLDELITFIQIRKAPIMLLECLKFIDSKSYKKFINRIFNEIKLDYIE